MASVFHPYKLLQVQLHANYISLTGCNLVLIPNKSGLITGKLGLTQCKEGMISLTDVITHKRIVLDSPFQKTQRPALFFYSDSAVCTLTQRCHAHRGVSQKFKPNSKILLGVC